jgi:hypothetical protein
MNEVIPNGVGTPEDDSEVFSCKDCGCDVTEDDFESVDDELNPQNPRCPACQSAQRVARNECDCGEAAAYEVESGFLCEDCHDHYVSGYIRD